MGYFTSFFIKPYKAPLLQAYKGSFVMDNDGRIISSTLSSAIPVALTQAIARTAIGIFRSPAMTNICLTEFAVDFTKLELLVTRSKLRIHVFLKAKTMVGP